LIKALSLAVKLVSTSLRKLGTFAIFKPPKPGENVPRRKPIRHTGRNEKDWLEGQSSQFDSALSCWDLAPLAAETLIELCMRY
jgi:hypothetical protein